MVKKKLLKKNNNDHTKNIIFSSCWSVFYHIFIMKYDNLFNSELQIDKVDTFNGILLNCITYTLYILWCIYYALYIIIIPDLSTKSIHEIIKRKIPYYNFSIIIVMNWTIEIRSLLFNKIIVIIIKHLLFV